MEPFLDKQAFLFGKCGNAHATLLTIAHYQNVIVSFFQHEKIGATEQSLSVYQENEYGPRKISGLSGTDEYFPDNQLSGDEDTQ